MTSYDKKVSGFPQQHANNAKGRTRKRSRKLALIYKRPYLDWVKGQENVSKTKKKVTANFHNIHLFMVEISTEYFLFSD